MTTQAQIAANRRNAKLSTGPRTARGKMISRQNALKDGLTGSGVVLTADDRAKVEARLPGYLAHYRPTNDTEEWDVRRTTIEMVRVDKCFDEEHRVRRDEMLRAMVNWVEDRETETAKLAARLALQPDVVALELNRTLWGAYWLLERWEYLRAALEMGEDWDENDRSKALDLLGVSYDMRRPGLTKVDAPEGEDSIAFRLAVAQERIDWLTERTEGPLAMLDEEHQERVANDLAAVDNPRLIRVRRCEAASLRRYYQARRALSARNRVDVSSSHAVSSETSSRPEGSTAVPESPLRYFPAQVVTPESVPDQPVTLQPSAPVAPNAPVNQTPARSYSTSFALSMPTVESLALSLEEQTEVMREYRERMDARSDLSLTFSERMRKMEAARFRKPEASAGG